MILKCLMLFTSLLSLASINKQNFCSRKMNHQNLISDFQKKENLISFRNSAGLFNGGVCWWHSKLQRKAHYLALFKPELNKLTPEEYGKIIRKLIKGKKIITIPGYKNFYDFSKDYKDYILKRLTLWQVKDGVIGFSWIRGLRGKTNTSAEKLKKSMKSLYSYTVEKKNFAYLKLQIKGISSHSWLVYDMKKNSEGYVLKLVDSNASTRPKEYTYKFGDTELKNFRKYGDFLVYLEEKKEQKRLKKTVKTFCEL